MRNEKLKIPLIVVVTLIVLSAIVLGTGTVKAEEVKNSVEDVLGISQPEPIESEVVAPVEVNGNSTNEGSEPKAVPVVHNDSNGIEHTSNYVASAEKGVAVPPAKTNIAG